MKSFFRIVALLLALGTAGFWFGKGAHTGWSQNRVPVSKTDDVTGIVYTAYEDRFVPGIEVLGAGLAIATALLGVSLFFRSTPKP